MAVVVWLAVVVAGSTMTWTTINTAGQEVLSPRAVPTPPVDRGPPPSVAAAPSERRVTIKPSPSAPESRAPRGPRTQRPTESPASPEPSSAPTRAPASTPAPGAQTPAPPPAAPPPAPAPQSSTWRGVAGVVTVSCAGAVISLQAASPSNGYAVEVRERGPDEVEVRLESDDEETRVEAVCFAGAARFSADS